MMNSFTGFCFERIDCKLAVSCCFRYYNGITMKDENVATDSKCSSFLGLGECVDCSLIVIHFSPHYNQSST